MNKIVLCLGIVAVAVLAAPADVSDRILLKDVEILQFNVGETAVNTRTPDVIPRVTCAYNPLGNDNLLPKTIICKNKGVDDTGAIIWKCEGEMDSSLAFDNIQISCEGYDYPGDEYIRRGSCALTYTTKTTQEAKKFNQQPRTNPVPPPPPGYHYQQPRTHEHYRVDPNVANAKSVWTFSNVLILVLVCVVVVRCCCKKKKTNTPMTENVEKKQYDNMSYNNVQPSAPPYENEEGSMSKRTGYAETVSR